MMNTYIIEQDRMTWRKDKLIQSLKGFFSMLSGLLCIVKKSIKLTQYTIVVNSDVCSTLREHHGLWTPREEIAFTARPKIPSQIFGYGRSIFCLPHRLKFSDIFDLCLHWASVVRREHQLRKKVPPAEGRDLSNRYRKEIEIIHRLFQVKNTAD